MPWNSKIPDLKNNPAYLEPRITAAESQLAEIAKHKLSWINVTQPPYNCDSSGNNDSTTGLINAINDAVSQKVPVYAPGRFKINGTVLHTFTGVDQPLTLIGDGFTSTFVDYNPTAPMLKLDGGSGTPVRLVVKGISFELAVSKPSVNSIEILNLTDSGFLFDECYFKGANNTFPINNFLLIKNMGKGSFKDCFFNEIAGKAIQYQCDDWNGGNLSFLDVNFNHCYAGIYFKGLQMINNVTFINTTWYGFNPIDAKNGYGTVTGCNFQYTQFGAGYQSAGTNQINMPTGYNAASNGDFMTNGIVIIYSSQGYELRRVSSYNSSNGVLTLADNISAPHSVTSDVRQYYSKAWGIITDFITVNMRLEGCYFEGVQNMFHEVQGISLDNTQFTLHNNGNQTINGNGNTTVYGNYLNGINTKEAKFKSTQFGCDSNQTVYLVHAAQPTGISAPPSFEIEGIYTYPAGQENQNSGSIRAFAADNNVLTNAKYRVRTSLEKGVQADNSLINPLYLKPSLQAIAGTIGDVEWVQDIQGTAKRFVAAVNGYKNGNATTQTITFPTPFTQQCMVVGNSTGISLTVSLTGLTFPASMVSGVSGVVIVEGI